MSTITKEFTKEQLIEKLQHRVAVTANYPDVEEAQLDAAIFKIALASLEAEPVAWLLSGGGAKNNVSFDSGNAYADPLREVTPLYTAPPAPVSVPAAMEMDDDFDSSFEHGKAVGWNAYRAVMLQGADSNSPVIPDGWVACSERMPETDGNYWGWWSESKRQGPVWFMKSDLQAQFQSSEITHWMPLPAAPLQEVKP
ncbi:DUF551 domain-containing protein [Enterobacter cloacae complex sp. ECL405]|uniref:DUF551 domain-containing protein n=1 Tax=Enterobacter cloacae complex TaxID=354276 RepID=UPI000F8978AD|nr:MULTISPECIES: DUF551 domain-containing protein [Enterobacter cloacae complex]UYT27989.1 DUF551 domain-containing protein [Enterobacter cloacae]MCK6754953.1 DUF551 domain-containing protein [Enterobacter asburiae]RTP84502.1 DUF551 domain-containing protein [Enterobacter asburiae]UKB56306.1 DUF551 domain-containing protein [Enterobacter cloacae complex sp. ECL405]UYT37241.1 DUF551 domain-containing protein [Enterobacter cloacae]